MVTNNEVSASEVEAAKAFEAELGKRPIEEQLAVGLISKNVLNGCSWEFVRSVNDLRRHEEDFRNSKTCSLQAVTYSRREGIYGYLVYMQMGKLLEILDTKNKGPLTSKDIDLANKHRKEAVESLMVLLQKGFQGKIGIYCTNDTQTITVKGTAYKAFAVTLRELCNILLKYGYGVVVSGIPRDPNEVLKREDAIIKSLVVAPSSNALFIDIAPMGKRR